MMSERPDTTGLDLAGRIPLMRESEPVETLVASLAERDGTYRAERLSGLHNPWGFAHGLTDPWPFLDLCESPEIVELTTGLIGPDILLWDSELYADPSRYRDFVAAGREGRYWPVDPLVGALVLVSFSPTGRQVIGIRLDDLSERGLPAIDMDHPLYVIRLMSARSHFVRDPDHPAHQACMREQVLINFVERPLWLLSGENAGGSDLTRGFSPATPTWARSAAPGSNEEN